MDESMFHDAVFSKASSFRQHPLMVDLDAILVSFGAHYPDNRFNVNPIQAQREWGHILTVEDSLQLDAGIFNRGSRSLKAAERHRIKK
jgi:hypothetical protein